MSGITFNDWAHDFLDEIGAPHNARNADVLIAWMYTESGSPSGYGKGGNFNPLNTTWRLTDSSAPSGHASWEFNYAHVQNFYSNSDGLYATKLTILQQNYGFPKIVKRLRGRLWTANSILKAIDDSAWGTSGLIFAVYRDVHGSYYWERANTKVAGSW